MGRTSKLSEQEKLELCQAYDKGECSVQSLAKKFCVSQSTVKSWYYRYKANGEKAFEASNRNHAYTKAFKDKIVVEYIEDHLSMIDISAKYNLHISNVRRWVNLYHQGIDNTSYEPKGEVYTMKSRKTSYEERITIVKEVLASDMQYALVAEKHMINYALVYQWTQKYLKDGETALKYAKRVRKPNNYLAENLSETEKLKRALKKESALRERLELQVELLKKKKTWR